MIDFSYHSKQDPAQRVDAGIASYSKLFLMSVQAGLIDAPGWWSVARDNWLTDFWHQAGNDLLAGAISTLVAKISTANWYVEGPELLATTYRNILLEQSDFLHGWDAFIEKWVQGYLSRDHGGMAERLRASDVDLTGPALGFAHLDESKCSFTNDYEYPVLYTGAQGCIKLHRSQVMVITDLPSGRDADYGVGFCSVSRALSTASILMDIVRYKRERLSDLPPAGLLMLNNVTEKQWEDITTKYDARMRNDNNTVWRDVMVAMGVDPECPVSAELFELSKLPEHYSEREATEMAVYTFALAFRVDPREFWPVSSGALGTATEASLQHLKAKAKGEGAIFTKIERQLNSPFSLPKHVRFAFDYRNDEDDERANQIAKLKIENVRRMWESSPNRSAVVEGQTNEGIITTDQARQLLAQEGLIPQEWSSGLSAPPEQFYDTKTYGPITRVYRDSTFQRYWFT